jgi:hypothetical protein
MSLTPSGLADAIENAMSALHPVMKGKPLPSVGLEDRRLLFLSIAQGLLQYLKDHEGEFVKSVDIDHTSGGSVDHSFEDLKLDIET